ncbi:MAG: hypothetical protein SOW03_05990 [Campylobacter sp.]|nr:hypothetical protein [Campylobacteraceae bacterium]MDY2635872.1 hypothetical protein [Campylobacter sp.]
MRGCGCDDKLGRSSVSNISWGALRWRYSGAWGIVVALIRILSGYFEIFL